MWFRNTLGVRLDGVGANWEDEKLVGGRKSKRIENI